MLESHRAITRNADQAARQLLTSFFMIQIALSFGMTSFPRPTALSTRVILISIADMKVQL